MLHTAHVKTMASLFRPFLSFFSWGNNAAVSEQRIAQQHHDEHKKESSQTDFAAKKGEIDLDMKFEDAEIHAIRLGELNDERLVRHAQALFADLEERARETGRRTETLIALERLLQEIESKMPLDERNRDELIVALNDEKARDLMEKKLIIESEHAKSSETREQDKAAVAREEALEEKDEEQERKLEAQLNTKNGI